MNDFIWSAAPDYFRIEAVPLIATAVIFAVLTAVTAVLVAKSLKGRDGDGSG